MEPESLSEVDLPKIDSYKVDAVSTILDDFENIVTKNYCVFANYEDFSYVESRSKNQLEEQFIKFVNSNLSGEFQLRNWFIDATIPRIYYL